MYLSNFNGKLCDNMILVIEISILLILSTVVFLLFKKINSKQIKKANEFEAQILSNRQEIR